MDDTELFYFSNVALLNAAETGDIEMVQLAIAPSADLDVKDDSGATALILASWREDIEMVQLLIDARANLDIKDDSGATALLRALTNDDTKMVNLLLEAGADTAPLTAVKRRAYFDMIGAIANRNISQVNDLIESGIDVNWFPSGEPALFIEAAGNPVIIDMLLNAGADPNVKFDTSPLDYEIMIDVIRDHDSSLVETLIAKRDVDVNWFPPGKHSLLAEAIREDEQGIVDTLLEAGADPNIDFSRLGSPSRQIIGLLRDAGVDPYGLY